MLLPDFNHGQKMTTIVFALANFCSATCISLQAPFFPQEAEKKGATASQYGFVFGIYELFVFLSSPFLGKYMHRLGARNVYLAGTFTTSTSCVVFGLLDEIPSTTAFITLSFIVRSMEAVGNSCILTSSFAIIAKEFPERTSTMLGWLETSFGLGLIIGPSLGATLYEAGGYFLPFLVLGGSLFLTATLSYFILPLSYNSRTVREESEEGWLALIKIPLVAISSFALFSSYISLGFILATLEPHLRSFNLSPIMLASLFIIHGASYGICAPFSGWLCDKVMKPLNVITTGAVLTTISLIFLGPLPFFPFEKSLPLVISCLVLHGVGFAATLVSSFGLSQKEAIAHGFPDNISTYGLISGSWTSASALGAFIGPSVSGILVDKFEFPWASLFTVVFELIVLVILIAYKVVEFRAQNNRQSDYERLYGTSESDPLMESNGNGSPISNRQPNTR